MKLRILRLLILALLLSPSLRAAAHIHDNYNSVHFNSGFPDFGELPRRCILQTEADVRSTWNGWGESDYRGNVIKTEINSQTDQLPAERDKRLRAEAKRAERQGHWNRARGIYLRLAAANGWSGDLRDRVSVIDEEDLARHVLAGTLIRRYFDALDAIRGSEAVTWPKGRRILMDIRADNRSGFLIPHACYQIASLDAAWFDFAGAIRGYKGLLRDYPRTTKREEALIMLARSALLPARPNPEDVADGRKAIQSLLRDDPGTRFRPAIIGMLARIDYCQGRYGNAVDAYLAIGDLSSVEQLLRYLPRQAKERVYPRLLCGYLRRLGRAETTDTYARAASGIRESLARLSPQGARDFVARLHSDHDLVPPYFYYRLYHCTNTPADTRGLAHLARRLSETWSAAALRPLVEVRFAEVFYRDGDYKSALRWAGLAAAHSKSGRFDRAAYVTGASCYKMRHFREAREAFESLLADCRQSPLRFAAREELALTCEALGDLPAALDQYFLLGYKTDVAFFVDARMTVDQLAAYDVSRAGRERHNLLTYSLALRYMRLERWAAARARFELLSPRVRRGLWKPADHADLGWGVYDNDPRDPMKTLADLSRLRSAADRRGISANARASALYHYASYYYLNGTLLVYNYAAWQGDRAFSFDYCWDNDVASAADIAAARRHMYEHDTYARTEALCRQISRDYPDSPTAPYALYRGACSASKLANMNAWWRGELRHHDHFREASNMMSLLARRYPHHPLAVDARKFARVFRDDADAAADELRSEDKEHGDNANGARNHGPGWFP